MDLEVLPFKSMTLFLVSRLHSGCSLANMLSPIESKILFEIQLLVSCASLFFWLLAALCLQEEVTQVRSFYSIKKHDVIK